MISAKKNSNIMAGQKQSSPSTNKSISITGDVKDSVVISGDNNTVKQTIIQKFFNIFKSDTETLEQRNRRILLNHVENAWIKGVLDASLHGAALLDLGIKQDPEAVTKYPWAIKKESTDETLPAGTSMLEIFDSIGMGRSLLILGAPGSGKTTMLLELARGLIARAREDITQPIPMVFNLSSWMESKTLADWLAQELNNLYSVPRKTAPDWVKGNKLLLLLDGLDEVRQESRVKCVEAINEFRKQNGFTSLAVCSRSQDYADLKAKLSFEGAIEVQPLTQGQIAEFFNRFGKEIAGIKQALEKDSNLREMAETPLFLSIMLMAYRDKRDVEILISGDEMARRKHLFDTYIERMFERRTKNRRYKKQDVVRWISWLARNMVDYGFTSFYIVNMKTFWIRNKQQRARISSLMIVFLFLLGLLTAGLIAGFLELKLPFADLALTATKPIIMDTDRLLFRFFSILSIVLTSGLSIVLILLYFLSNSNDPFEIEKFVRASLSDELDPYTKYAIANRKTIELMDDRDSFCILLPGALLLAIVIRFLGIVGIDSEVLMLWIVIVSGYSFVTGYLGILIYGNIPILNRFLFRWLLYILHRIPFRLSHFLDHCVDLIFLRRVGGGYIFIHRLLMEHFAEMYGETTK